MTRPETRIVKAEYAHAEHVALHMRQADIDEIEAMGLAPAGAVMVSWYRAMLSWAWLVNEEPAAVFGISAQSFTSDQGMPWAITTSLVEKHRKAFLIDSRKAFADCFGNYRYMFNVVDDRHESAKRWLRWLGFEIGEPQPYGPHGLPFRRFEYRREHVR